MRQILRFLLYACLWGFLAWLPFLICDHDLREAVYWQERQPAIARYLVITIAQAGVFALLFPIFGRRDQLRLAQSFALGALLCTVPVALHYWVALPVSGDNHYRPFLITVFVSKALRVFTNTYFVLYVVVACWRAVKARGRNITQSTASDQPV